VRTEVTDRTPIFGERYLQVMALFEPLLEDAGSHGLLPQIEHSR
jgi:hypothetical protein